MQLQDLDKFFENAIQNQRLVRLGQLEQGSYADIKEAAKLSGHCQGLNQGLSLFREVANNLLSNTNTSNVLPTEPSDQE